ncbi:hypothetical protein Nepgr_024805 [Nepenthes gracilis]|uniref:Uncharacterized protein n=1 Tax=Nepenthes gracilis TaxID=150966 RepID=A0AAD3XYZ1_NEPGR|nr:hypothetical protein Nepgr_024805 [Nepenthes gracilis]
MASTGKPESMRMVLKAVLSPESHVVSIEQLIPSTPPALNHDVAKGIVLDVIDSDNSFTILRDSEDLEVKELHCGPPNPEALITNDEIPTKIGSVPDSLVELTCVAPNLATGNKPMLPLNPLGLALDSSDNVPSCLLGNLQLDTFSQAADEKAEGSCVGCALRSENLGLGSISSKSETELVLLAQVTNLVCTPESITRLTSKYLLDEAGPVEKVVGVGVSEGSDQRTLDCYTVINSAQSPMVSAAEEVGDDPLSLAIQMLTEEEATRLLLKAPRPNHRYTVYVEYDAASPDAILADAVDYWFGNILAWLVYWRGRGGCLRMGFRKIMLQGMLSVADVLWKSMTGALVYGFDQLCSAGLECIPCSAVLGRCSIGWGSGRCTCVGARWLDSGWPHCVVLCSYVVGSGMVAYSLSQVLFQTNLV